MPGNSRLLVSIVAFEDVLVPEWLTANLVAVNLHLVIPSSCVSHANVNTPVCVVNIVVYYSAAIVTPSVVPHTNLDFSTSANNLVASDVHA